MKTPVIPEAAYDLHMDTEVAAFVRNSLKHIRLSGKDGSKIHAVYALNPDAKAAVLLVHGLSEFADRWLEHLYYFYEEGYSVFMPDHRGHGRSARKVPESDHIFIRDFDEYTSDLDVVYHELLKAKEPDLPVFLYGHSMGGCISALYLEEHPEAFKAAILTSPMLRINFGKTPLWQIKALAGVSRILGWNNKTMGKEGFDANPSFEESCGTSEARFMRQLRTRRAHRAYQTENVTFAWARAALKATDRLMAHSDQADLPILICQAGNDTLVDNAAEEQFAAAAPSATLVRFPEAKHEIFNATDDVLNAYWPTVFDYLEKQLAE